MTRIAIVGGHGQVARQLVHLLRRAGHDPVALVRNEAYREELEGRGAEVRMLDIERQGATEFATAFAGCEAVVFAAGGGPDGNIERKRTVDLEGSLKSIEGARAAGIRRFVQVSAIGVDDPLPADTGAVWRAYVAAKRDADAALRASDLDWTIIRPGRLTDEPATGRVALGADVARGDVTRADVAAVLAAVFDVPGSIGQQWNLVSGEVPVEQAVHSPDGRSVHSSSAREE
ncbi:MAG: SDR family oxidoreductase [Nocardioides sp.]|nr:SDR family oxidoreductase [Nocardioides sp.]